MRKPKLLLVDDQVLHVTNLGKLLSRRGYSVSAVFDGDSAVRLVEVEDFDVVVLDQKMPGKDGITTLRELKKRRPHLEVIILTGYGSVDAAIDGIRFGAFDYTTKPIFFPDLEEKIDEAFQRRLLHEETGKVDRH